MRIINLKAENVKGLKAIEITPDEHFQVIAGRNGQGKTSVLDAMWLALGGKDASKTIDKPLRDGAKEGFSTVDLGDIVVTRKWKGETTTLEVRSKEGAKYDSPQKVLDALIGKLSFDPQAFAMMEDKKQKAALQELVGIDFTRLDAQRKSLFTDRTETNRETEKYKALLEKLPKPKKDLPAEEIKASDIIDAITKAQQVISANEAKRSEVNRTREQYRELTAKIKELTEQQASLALHGRELGLVVEKLVDPDITELQEKLRNNEAINQDIRDAAEYAKAKKNYDLCVEESEQLTKEIKDIDQAKSDTLQSTVFPVDGLGFDEEGVTYNGIPFSQCSGMERLKVSVSMAMSLNPELRVIRVTDGSLLDSTNMKVIEDMAKEKDFQVWMEVVDETGAIGVTIEDGMVK